ncbi:MAG: hypothetical protein JWP36_2177 [Paucimonas sp.]|nr:hypothetical protein [Paucimonas sp.]
MTCFVRASQALLLTALAATTATGYAQEFPRPVGAVDSGGLPPVGSTTVPGTSTQIFPHPPLANSSALGPGYGSSVPQPSFGSSAGSSLGGLSSGSSVTSSVASPTSVTSANVPGYTAPGTTPLPGYSAPPGTIGFPPVTSVPTPGVPITGTEIMSGSGANNGIGGAGVDAAGRRFP